MYEKPLKILLKSNLIRGFYIDVPLAALPAQVLRV